MSKKKIISFAFLHAVVATVYIILVALFMTNAEAILGPGEGTPLAASAFLLTFVLSAAIMGVVIFGRPIMWYLNGEKHEAVHLVFYTIFFLVVITLVVFITLAFGYGT